MELQENIGFNGLPLQRVGETLTGTEHFDNAHLHALGGMVRDLTPTQRASLSGLTVRQVSELRRLTERMTGLIIPETPKEEGGKKSLSEVFDWAIQVAKERGAAGDIIFQGMNWEVEKQSPQAN